MPLHCVLRIGLVVILACPMAGIATPHPLDGLDLDEHRRAIALLDAAGGLDGETVVAGMHLIEPPKAEVMAAAPGALHGRRALVVLRRAGRVFEATVDLVGGEIRLDEVPGAQSQFTDRDYTIAAETALASAQVRALLAAHGVADPATVDCFAAGSAIAVPAAARTMRVRCAERRGARSVAARVLEGIDVLVDVDAARVLHARDAGPSARTDAVADLDAAAVGPDRAPLPQGTARPREIHGFTIDGGLVHWGEWRFHLRMDPRVGVVLSTVSIDDGARRRSVLYQAHLSEIFVPYMDPAPGWYDRAVLDAGEYAYDGLAESLAPGIDCPADAAFIEGVSTDERGVSRPRPRVACLFERDTGLVAWRKGIEGSEAVQGRPARELVVRMVATIGNYDYLFDWSFQRDGTLRVAVGASGQLAVKVADDARHGHRVADGVVAVNHDHHFAFRLDLDVDGPVNSLVGTRLQAVRLPESNPRGAIWVPRERTIRSERELLQGHVSEHAVQWRVVNPDARNAADHPTGYELRAGHAATPAALIADLDPVHRRAGFVRHALWVTPHDAAERHAAGDYPLLASTPAGLPAWTARDRPVERTDLVLWHVVGMHHLPRTEDWPVMPVLWHAFELRPFDFFDRNPALDLPRQP
ncbi:copper amine oxidase [Luteimonas sp. A611]